ncbi:MAG TPA: carboxypeptidase regulatory-like domain-containing protein [Minicystis sp.]|nr:carboxypeptidase regulatory-like domain-containing protein [Minicystis sp.]
MIRQLASFLAVSFAAMALAGCPESEAPKKEKAHKEHAESKGHAANQKGEKKGEEKAEKKGGGGAEGKFGTATIKGVVDFTGKAPEMKVPAKRKDAEFCKDKEIKYNAVVVNDGKLQDVLVRIAPGALKGDYKGKAAEIDQKDCMYEPRIQGVVAGSDIMIKNGDSTLHNVHTFKGTETWFNQAQPKGSDPIKKEMPEDNKIVKFTCDVHPWMHGFVVVTDHPFFAVSGKDGTFTIEKVPAGDYDVEAWHTQYGLKKGHVKVEDGKTAEVKFTYDGTEAEPAENKDELKGLW